MIFNKLKFMESSPLLEEAHCNTDIKILDLILKSRKNYLDKIDTLNDVENDFNSRDVYISSFIREVKTIIEMYDAYMLSYEDDKTKELVYIIGFKEGNQVRLLQFKLGLNGREDKRKYIELISTDHYYNISRIKFDLLKSTHIEKETLKRLPNNTIKTIELYHNKIKNNKK